MSIPNKAECRWRSHVHRAIALGGHCPQEMCEPHTWLAEIYAQLARPAVPAAHLATLLAARRFNARELLRLERAREELLSCA